MSIVIRLLEMGLSNNGYTSFAPNNTVSENGGVRVFDRDKNI